jgi:hypothetical protein
LSVLTALWFLLTYQCVVAAQTINTSCTLYPNAAYCTTTSTGAVQAEQQRETYETGQAIGNSIGMAIFQAHFPGWRRKYCSKHPDQPFYYGNAKGDSITGTCPGFQGLANEAAAEFVAKHPGAVKSTEHATAIEKYLTDNRLPFWEPKSYDKAAQATANGPWEAKPASAASPGSARLSSIGSTKPQDLFVWFDEPSPASGSPLFEALATARAYEGALTILRQARQGNTSVQAGTSVLDTDYHPSTVSLEYWQKSNPASEPTLFYWQGEDVSPTTSVMHFQMTKRAYEQMLALIAGSDLRVRPSKEKVKDQ